MGFFTKSPITGAHSFVSTMPGTFYFWGSVALSIFILTSTVYSLFGRGYEGILTSPTIMFSAIFHSILLLLMAWAYLRVRLTSPGYLLRTGRLTKREVRGLEEGEIKVITPRDVELLSREFMVCGPDGSPKFCETCHAFRPARASHCEVKGRCVVKFDHYCPLLSSAIGIRNYKYYINALVFLFLLVGYLFSMGVVTVVRIGSNGWTITLLVYSAVMFLFISSILGLHLTIIMQNVTTKEYNACQSLKASRNKVVVNQHIFVRCNVADFWPNYPLGPPNPDFATIPPIVVSVDLSSKPWSQTRWENWKGVMGASWWRWFLPLSPKLEKEKWWECEFNEETKMLLRRKATDMLWGIWRDEQVHKPEQMHA